MIKTTPKLVTGKETIEQMHHYYVTAMSSRRQVVGERMELVSYPEIRCEGFYCNKILLFSRSCVKCHLRANIQRWNMCASLALMSATTRRCSLLTACSASSFCSSGMSSRGVRRRLKLLSEVQHLLPCD